MPGSPNDPTNGLREILNGAQDTGWFRGKRLWPLAGIAVILAVWLFSFGGGDGALGQYVSEPAATGSVTVTASASGILQPIKSVDVGSELSGTLSRVLVQENDEVKRGQLLAELDKTRLEDAVAKSQAALAAADAGVVQARATLAETMASLSRLRQVAELSGGKVPAKIELEAAEAGLQRAQANQASANAVVLQARATLKTDETNLSKAAIRSPMDGVVLARKVEPGNTVVAAMTTPVLFVLGEDLSAMELQAKVDEADVATVRPGQLATFTVSAWPGRRFPALIKRVALGSSTTDNVVTYKTVLQVDNHDLALRPGMTATASIVTARRENVLLVPNAALRFTPSEVTTKPGGGVVANLLPHPPEQPKRRVNAADGAGSQLWVQGATGPQPLSVKTGVTDGRYTEVVGGNLKPGMEVITDFQVRKK